VFDSWLRDSHDLWHTVTGYKGDLIGEASLLAFSFAQTRHPGVGLIVLGALLRTTAFGRGHGPVEPSAEVDVALFRRMIVQGFLRGLRAKWLVAQDWDTLLARPLGEVRDELGLGDAPSYVPLRTSDVGLAAA
jgi:ubiquinone biosynthesis protein COQ4